MNGIAPKFGWGWEQHGALEGGAVQLLPDSPLKHFMDGHIDSVNFHSIRQDREFSGSHHALNVELLGTDRFGRRPPFPRTRQVFERFAPENLAEREAFAQAAPLPDHPDLQQKPNVYRQIMADYRALADDFRQLKAHPPRLWPQKMKTARALEEKIGALVHYIGDMHQPMHLAEHYTWAIKERWDSVKGVPAKDSHLFMESEVRYRAEELETWRNNLAPTNIPGRLTDKQLSDLLIRQIRASYLKMFDLVGADRQARETRETPYLQALTENMTPVVDAQLTQAAQTVAKVVHSAWLAGEQPDLGKLRVPSHVERAVQSMAKGMADKPKLTRFKERLQRLLPPGPPDISRRPWLPYNPSPPR